MKKQNSHTIEWSKSKGRNFCIMVFDNNEKDLDFNNIAFFAFDNISHYVLGKRFAQKDYPVLDDWKKAVEKRINGFVDWSKIEPTGGSITIVN